MSRCARLVLAFGVLVVAREALAAPPPKRTSMTVSSSNPSSVFGEPLTFTGIVSGAGQGTPSGAVDFSLDGAVVAKGNLDATGSASALAPLLAVGTYTLAAAYGGDGTFAPSVSRSVVQSVTLASTTTATSTAASSGTSFGVLVTFTASVDPVAPSLAIPTGMVSIRDGATVIATLPLDGAGRAQAQAALGVGGHSISSEYAGSAGHAASVSPAILHRVDRSATSGALGTSPNPSLVGQAVTFTATVKQPSGDVVPTGFVTLRDTQTNAVLATPTLDATGTATFTTTELPVGAHAYALVYDGDQNYVGGDLATGAQTVLDPNEPSDAGVVDGGPSDAGSTTDDAGTSADAGGDADASAAPPSADDVPNVRDDGGANSNDPGSAAAVLGGSGCDCRVDVARARGSAGLAVLWGAVSVGACIQRRRRRRHAMDDSATTPTNDGAAPPDASGDGPHPRG